MNAASISRKASTTRKLAAYNVRRWRSGTLIVGGFGFTSAAFYEWSTMAGLLATGVSLFALEWATRKEKAA